MSGALLPVTEFGPYDPIADVAHALYVDGDCEGSVRTCAEGLALTRAAGDHLTTRYLLYVGGVALQELGRHEEAATAAQQLLAAVDPHAEPLWRAKALALLAEASTSLGEMSRAMDSLAEGSYLIRRPSTEYNHMSASMAVGIALRSLMLFEEADELLMQTVRRSEGPVVVLTLQEAALLQLYWGATLDVLGDRARARPHYLSAARRALRMHALAVRYGDEGMAATARLYEAYFWERCGEPARAEQMVRETLSAHPQRPGKTEGHLARLVLGRVAAGRGAFAEAREHLAGASDEAERAGRDVWAATGLMSLAEVDEAEIGHHPGMSRWRALARVLLRRMWRDREGRFSALQARIRVRELMDETHRMGREALADPLTGLGNRRQLAEHMSTEREVSVVFVDVDDFKQVNDGFSHQVGDQVLQGIASILETHCRAGDVVVRYGGDEFIVLVDGDPAAATSIAERVLEAVRRAPWDDLAPGLQVSVSMGLARSLPAQDALTAADSALYSAKRAGRDRVVVY